MVADNKKYYYMRLKENFFETDEMIFLESMEEGFLFSNILLKLYLRSLKNEGLLMMNEIVPYDARMISRFTNHPLSTVEKALFEFKKLGLIEVLDSGQMYMSNIELFVGKTTTEADRKRSARMKIEQRFSIVTNVGQMSEKNPPEIKLEKKKDIKLNKEKDKTVQQVEQPSVEDQFETWWKNYPKKMDKKAALKSFKTAIKNNSFEVLMNGLLEYNKYIKFKRFEKEFIKNATTFLNQESFKNDYSELMQSKPRYQNKGHQPYIAPQQDYVEPEREIIQLADDDLPF